MATVLWHFFFGSDAFPRFSYRGGSQRVAENRAVRDGCEFPGIPRIVSDAEWKRRREAAAANLFQVRYEHAGRVWRTVASGRDRAEAEATFRRQNPHVRLVAHE